LPNNAWNVVLIGIDVPLNEWSAASDTVTMYLRPISNGESFGRSKTDRTIGCTKVAERCVLAMERSSRRLGDP
jgi:hypothetical protein